jgi:hypothetical protein
MSAETDEVTEQREKLVRAIDRLHEEATCGSGYMAEDAAIRLAVALGWTTDDPEQQPFGDWMRARLREVLR